jgi:mannitol/fructose-specific phosphotransferase system IIA component (Ntr-type)
MNLSELLGDPPAVRIPLHGASKRSVIAELVQLLEQAHHIESNGDVLSRVLERERLMSTGIGFGVAIPHAKSPHLKEVAASCGVVPAGLDYEAADREPVKLLFLVVSPEEVRAGHVRALAAISKLVHSREVREALLDAGDPQAFVECLIDAEEDSG